MKNQLWKRIYFTHIIFKIIVSSSLKIICYILMIFSYINKRFLLCYSFWGFYFTILKNVKSKIFVYICRWFEMLLAHGKWWNIDLLFWKTFSVFLLMILFCYFFYWILFQPIWHTNFPLSDDQSQNAKNTWAYGQLRSSQICKVVCIALLATIKMSLNLDFLWNFSL